MSGHKINIQKTIVFLYSSTEQPKNEIKEAISLVVKFKRIKYSGIYLTK